MLLIIVFKKGFVYTIKKKGGATANIEYVTLKIYGKSTVSAAESDRQSFHGSFLYTVIHSHVSEVKTTMYKILILNCAVTNYHFHMNKKCAKF